LDLQDAIRSIRQYGKNTGIARGIYRYGSGEPAKGRQDRKILPKIKTRKLKGLPTHTADAYPRMDMAGEKIPWVALSGSPGLAIGYIMDKGKGALLPTRLIHNDACVVVPFRFQDIMVSLDQANLQVREIIPPLPEQVQLLILPAMEKIPYDQQLSRLKILDQG
jgi:hypothetical protein